MNNFASNSSLLVHHYHLVDCSMSFNFVNNFSSLLLNFGVVLIVATNYILNVCCCCRTSAFCPFIIYIHKEF